MPLPKLKGEQRKIVLWECTRATFKEDLKEKLKLLGKLGKGIVEDVLEWLVVKWCRAFFLDHATYIDGRTGLMIESNFIIDHQGAMD